MNEPEKRQKHEVLIAPHSKDEQFIQLRGNEHIVEFDYESDAKAAVTFVKELVEIFKDALRLARTGK